MSASVIGDVVTSATPGLVVEIIGVDDSSTDGTGAPVQTAEPPEPRRGCGVHGSP